MVAVCTTKSIIVFWEPVSLEYNFFLVKSSSPSGGGVLHNFQYGEVHANVCGLKFYINQYLGSVNYNMD